MRLRRPALSVILVVAAVLGGACGGGSSSVELAEDASDATLPGVPPTAPVTDPNAGLSQTGEELLTQMTALTEEPDLCGALSSRAFTTLLSGEFDTAALVTSPAGLTRIVATLNSVFAHLVSISPAGVRPAMEQISGAWQRVVTINPNLPDSSEQARLIMEDPAIRGAQDEVGSWLAFNCAGALPR